MTHRRTEVDRPDLNTLDDPYRAMTDPEALQQKEWLWAYLPMYGEEPPEDDFGVWSWDEDRCSSAPPAPIPASWTARTGRAIRRTTSSAGAARGRAQPLPAAAGRG